MVVAATKRFTPEDLLTMPGGDNYELIDGRLVERYRSALSSFVAGQVGAALANHVHSAALGWVFAGKASFQCFPTDRNKVRKSDKSFVSASRMTAEDVRTQGHITIVPDLVLEVLSPNDLAYEVNRRIEEWLEAGVKMVWEIDPETKKVHVHRADGTMAKLGVADDLVADEVLPGFRCPIASLFP